MAKKAKPWEPRLVTDDGRCGRVGEDSRRRCPRPAQPKHACPYRAEVRGDARTKCTCCAACTKQCALDI